MKSRKEVFTPQTIIETQLDIFERFSEKVNKVFLKMMSRSKSELLESDPLLIETIGLLREFSVWYVKTTKAMISHNLMGLPKKKKEEWD